MANVFGFISAIAGLIGLAALVALILSLLGVGLTFSAWAFFGIFAGAFTVNMLFGQIAQDLR